jgi:hypothetical protein
LTTKGQAERQSASIEENAPMNFSLRGLFVVTIYAAIFSAAVARASFVSFWAVFIAASSLVVASARIGKRLQGPGKSYLLTFSAIATLGLIRTLLLYEPFFGGWVVVKMISVGGPFSPTATAFMCVMYVLLGMCVAIIGATLTAALHYVFAKLREK